MVMGLNNSGQTWQRLLTKVLSNMLYKSAIVYLDDVMIFSKDFLEHYKHLEMLVQKFRDANLSMNGKVFLCKRRSEIYWTCFEYGRDPY